MPIPDYQTLMLPILKFYGNSGQEHSFREVADALANQFCLTDQEKNEMLPSGQQAIFDNRVGWAKTYLKKANLIETTRRGYNKITQRGIDVLRQKLENLDANYLTKFDEFKAFRALRHPKGTVAEEESETESNGRTPEEILEIAYQKIRNDLATDLLQQLKSCSPSFFERLVVEVIVKMGYGGTRQDAGKAIGKSGDGGIDGIIKEDKLGLDAIYIQAKRWENTIGRPEIQKFVGALTGQRARKGLFITTSDFTSDAKEYVSRIDTKIVLIDGETLADLMIDHNVGISIIGTYELKKIDSDYFIEE
ncbi:MAG: restriction endonuclease [Phycisphaerae bacterium]|nr:restriction endonuclease [Phycisphaerae bacterium]